MSERRIFEGELGEIHLPDVLTFLDMLGKTGTLEVCRGPVTKRVYWDKGEIVFADSDLPSDRVADYLCRNGDITPDDVLAARNTASTEKDVIAHLIRSGRLEPAALPRAVKDLVLELVYSLFEWDDGTFSFIIKDEAHPEKLPLRTTVANTIVEGCRRMDEWRRIREHIPSDDCYPFRATESASVSVKLAPADQEILAEVDGRKSVARIVQAVSQDHLSTLSSLLTLKNAGLVKFRDEPLLEKAPIVSATSGNGLPAADRTSAEAMVTAFNNIFAGIHSRISSVKGGKGLERFAATLQKGSFQRGGVFTGVKFDADGRIPTTEILHNVAGVTDSDRLTKLKGSLDRLLAQQVLQLDTSFPSEDKQAISDLISREKASLPGA